MSPSAPAAGDQLRLRVLREGDVRELSYEVRSHKLLVPTLHGVDGCTPTYFTIAGLIFVPLSIPFLEHAYGGALPAELRASAARVNADILAVTPRRTWWHPWC